MRGARCMLRHGRKLSILIRSPIHFYFVLNRSLVNKVKLQTQGAFSTANRMALTETTAYTDVMAMQKMLMLVYLPLPIFLAILVSEVCPETKRKR